jgi:choline dehydrogenase-like flavoprotein
MGPLVRGAILLTATVLFGLLVVHNLLFAVSVPLTYDYIVVGGGSTGSVVAGRLGQAGYSVLVLEAGGPTQRSLGGGSDPILGEWTIFDVPLGWVQVRAQWPLSRPASWREEEQRIRRRRIVAHSRRATCLRSKRRPGLGTILVGALLWILARLPPGRKRRRRPHPPLLCRQVLSDHRWSKEFQWDVPADPPPAIARGLGGCGIHNAMLYMRGRPEDFTSWGEGWSWDEVLPFYLRSEDNTEWRNSSLHGTDGPVRVTGVSTDAISSSFVHAAVKAGHASINDFNGPLRKGAGFYQFMIRDGVRDSAGAAYLGGERQPPTVVVKAHALATRLLFQGESSWGVCAAGGRQGGRRGGSVGRMVPWGIDQGRVGVGVVVDVQERRVLEGWWMSVA